jgi:hypothetical protein
MTDETKTTLRPYEDLRDAVETEFGRSENSIVTARLDALLAERDRLRAALATSEAEARRYASHYPQSSDGRNTFLMLAEKIAECANAR